MFNVWIRNLPLSVLNIMRLLLMSTIKMCANSRSLSPGLSIDRTLKMYIGGSQKRPDAPYCRPVRGASGGVVGQVAEGNRKDIREAVEAAHKAAPGWVCSLQWGRWNLFPCLGRWGKRAAHNRAQIVYYIAENLELRHREVAQRIADMTGRLMWLSCDCHVTVTWLPWLQVVSMRTVRRR